MWGAHKNTQINSRGCREGPTENTYVQGPEFGATPLLLHNVLQQDQDNQGSACQIQVYDLIFLWNVWQCFIQVNGGKAFLVLWCRNPPKCHRRTIRKQWMAHALSGDDKVFQPLKQFILTVAYQLDVSWTWLLQQRESGGWLIPVEPSSIKWFYDSVWKTYRSTVMPAN